MHVRLIKVLKGARLCLRFFFHVILTSHMIMLGKKWKTEQMSLLGSKSISNNSSCAIRGL